VDSIQKFYNENRRIFNEWILKLKQTKAMSEKNEQKQIIEKISKDTAGYYSCGLVIAYRHFKNFFKFF